MPPLANELAISRKSRNPCNLQKKRLGQDERKSAEIAMQFKGRAVEKIDETY
jgi:hypothetical protein